MGGFTGASKAISRAWIPCEKMPPLCNRLTVSLGSGTFLRLPMALFNYERKIKKKHSFWLLQCTNSWRSRIGTVISKLFICGLRVPLGIVFVGFHRKKLKKKSLLLNNAAQLTILLFVIFSCSVVKNYIMTMIIGNWCNFPCALAVPLVSPFADDSRVILEVLKNQWSFSHQQRTYFFSIMK